MSLVDDSEITRELEWFEGVSAELRQQGSERDLKENTRKALTALVTAVDGAISAYRAVRAETGKLPYTLSERGYDIARRKLIAHARLLSLMAQRGGLELKLANDPSMLQRGEEIFIRIAAGEDLVNRLNDAFPKP